MLPGLLMKTENRSGFWVTFGFGVNCGVTVGSQEAAATRTWGDWPRPALGGTWGCAAGSQRTPLAWTGPPFEIQNPRSLAAVAWGPAGGSARLHPSRERAGFR